MHQSPEQKSKHNQYRKAYREKTSSPEQKAKQNKYKRNYRSDQKAKCYEKHKEYKSKKKLLSIESAISKFHNMDAEGPVYTFFCCDQLWCGPSVLNAEKLKDLSPVIHE